jgi:ABC-2 type transport system permease protein
MLPGRRGLLMGAAAALPLVPALLHGSLIPPEEIGVARLWTLIVDGFYLRALVPVAAVAFAVGLVSDEADGGTLLYLLTRPVPRWAILVGKLGAYLVATLVPVGISIALTHTVLRAKDPAGMLGDSGSLAWSLAAVLGGLAAYGGLFLAVGTWLRKPLLLAVLFAFGWENVATAIPGRLRHLTVLDYELRLAEQATPAADGAVGIPIAVLAGLFLVGTAMAIVVFRRRPYVLSRLP